MLMAILCILRTFVFLLPKQQTNTRRISQLVFEGVLKLTFRAFHALGEFREFSYEHSFLFVFFYEKRLNKRAHIRSIIKELSDLLNTEFQFPNPLTELRMISSAADGATPCKYLYVLDDTSTVSHA